MVGSKGGKIITCILLWPISTGHAFRLLRIDSVTPIPNSRPYILRHSDRLSTTSYESFQRTGLWRELCSTYRLELLDSEEGADYVGMVRTGDWYGVDVDLPICVFSNDDGDDGHVLVARLQATLDWNGSLP